MEKNAQKFTRLVKECAKHLSYWDWESPLAEIGEMYQQLPAVVDEDPAHPQTITTFDPQTKRVHLNSAAAVFRDVEDETVLKNRICFALFREAAHQMLDFDRRKGEDRDPEIWQRAVDREISGLLKSFVTERAKHREANRELREIIIAAAPSCLKVSGDNDETGNWVEDIIREINEGIWPMDRFTPDYRSDAESTYKRLMSEKFAAENPFEVRKREFRRKIGMR